MYNYEICNSVTVETTEQGRKYKTPDGIFPSVTTILGNTANMPWLDAWIERVGKEEAKRISKEATDRGELIHKYLERYWNKEEVFSDLLKETSDVQLMTRRLIEATQKNITALYGQELPLWSKKLGFAGRLDAIGEWRNEPAIIDFKTSKKKKTDVTDYYIQCAAYCYAHNELFNTEITKLVILITIETGGVQAFYGDMRHYLPDLKYRIKQYHKLQEEK